MIPDVEALVTSHLKAQSSISALGARIVGETPGDTSEPWVRVTQFDAPAVGASRTDHLIEWFGQFDCYAGSGGQGEASALTRTVREALRLMPDASHEGGVVTGVRFVSCPRLPDQDFEPARQRFSLSAVIWVHR